MYVKKESYWKFCACIFFLFDGNEWNEKKFQPSVKDEKS